MSFNFGQILSKLSTLQERCRPLSENNKFLSKVKEHAVNLNQVNLFFSLIAFCVCVCLFCFFFHFFLLFVFTSGHVHRNDGKARFYHDCWYRKKKVR